MRLIRVVLRHYPAVLFAGFAVSEVIRLRSDPKTVSWLDTWYGIAAMVCVCFVIDAMSKSLGKWYAKYLDDRHKARLFDETAETIARLQQQLDDLEEKGVHIRESNKKVERDLQRLDQKLEEIKEEDRPYGDLGPPI